MQNQKDMLLKLLRYTSNGQGLETFVAAPIPCDRGGGVTQSFLRRITLPSGIL